MLLFSALIVTAPTTHTVCMADMGGGNAFLRADFGGGRMEEQAFSLEHDGENEGVL
jgi:hypothetical protein